MKVDVWPFWCLRGRLLYSAVRIGIAVTPKTDDTVFQGDCKVILNCRRIMFPHFTAVVMESQSSLRFCFCSLTINNLCVSLWEQHRIKLCFGTLSSQKHKLFFSCNDRQSVIVVWKGSHVYIGCCDKGVQRNSELSASLLSNRRWFLSKYVCARVLWVQEHWQIKAE